MSADNWTICPRCKKEKEAELAQRRAELSEDYGKIEQAEFLRQTKALDEWEAENLSSTLREDYTVGIWGDEFEVRYSCSCQDCGFEFRFVEERTVEC